MFSILNDHLIGNSLEIFSHFGKIILSGELHLPPCDFSTDAVQPEEAEHCTQCSSSPGLFNQELSHLHPASLNPAWLSSHCLKTGKGENTLGLNNTHLDWNIS